MSGVAPLHQPDQPFVVVVNGVVVWIAVAVCAVKLVPAVAMFPGSRHREAMTFVLFRSYTLPLLVRLSVLREGGDDTTVRLACKEHPHTHTGTTHTTAAQSGCTPQQRTPQRDHGGRQLRRPRPVLEITRCSHPRTPPLSLPRYLDLPLRHTRCSPPLRKIQR